MKDKDNHIIVDYSKHMKLGKDILEVPVRKDVLGNYVYNIYEFSNTIIAENNKKIKSVEIDKLMAYLFISKS